MKKGFNLVEILLTMTLIGVIAVGLLPVLTKRAQRSSNPDCLNGMKNIEKIYMSNDTFIVPENIASNITVTMIGGGSGGYSGSYKSGLEQGTSSCALPVLRDDNNNIDSRFYTNVSYNATKAGGSASCSASPPKAGDSGEYILNMKIDIERPQTGQNITNVFYHSISSDSCLINNNEVQLSWKNANPGDSSNDSYNPQYLYGGAPPQNIVVDSSIVGIGQSCMLNGDRTGYTPISASLGSGCVISYKTAKPGAGGNAGNYAKLDLPLNAGVSCTVAIGKGGNSDVSGSDSSLECDGVTYSTNGENIPQDNLHKGSEGISPSKESVISGGSGGSSMKGENVVYSEGARGGCFGATKSSECSDPNGENGVNGAGGGGGSCNDNGCGRGGFGGDGLIVIEYKEQCK